MSWLLFLDESGHDHKSMPYEVRGGIALHAARVWPFVREMQQFEVECFGAQLHQYRKELKGSTLLDRKRFRFAAQSATLALHERQRLCRAFLTAGLEQRAPRREEFTAYGQACLQMAHGILAALQCHEAVLFAAAIPRTVAKPESWHADEFLRKDQVFLLERYFYFLEAKQEHGLLVLDAVEKQFDRKFVRQMESYFTRTQPGLYRSTWIVPAPLFVSSDLTSPIQAADLCIYLVNWGFRLPSQGMDAAVRTEIADQFGAALRQLQFRGQGKRDGKTFDSYGICYVPSPYSPGRH